MATALPLEPYDWDWEDIISSALNGGAPGFGTDPVDGKNDLVEDADEIRLREYQKVLAELAVSRNVIACLPTGAGKTHISVELAKHFVATRVNRSQKVVFLAPTVPLTNQQFGVFQQYFNCVKYTGGHAVNGRLQFLTSTDAAQVIFFTPEIFRAGLESGTIVFHDICLLILDECHHTVKKNPMNLVMSLYRKEKEDGHAVPRILGLSATIIKKNVTHLELDQHLQKAEVLLDSTAVTYEDYDEVQKFSTNAKIRIIPYQAESQEVLRKYLVPIRQMLETLQALPLAMTYPSPFQRPDPDNTLGEDLTKEFERVLRDVTQAGEYGQIGVVISAARKLRYLNELSVDKKFTGVKSSVCHAIKTALLQVIVIAQADLRKPYPRAPLEALEVSQKVLMILCILAQYRDKKNTPEELSGLVFVQTQKLAYCLFDILQEWAQSDPELNGFIRPGLVVGSVNPKQVPRAERVTKSRQNKVIDCFRRKELNLLVTTSILEEGIDVPSCNLVLRVDPLTSYVSMVQSIGRARMKDAVYYVLALEGETGDAEGKVDKFEEVKIKLTDKLIERMAAISLPEGTP